MNLDDDKHFLKLYLSSLADFNIDSNQKHCLEIKLEDENLFGQHIEDGSAADRTFKLAKNDHNQQKVEFVYCIREEQQNVRMDNIKRST